MFRPHDTVFLFWFLCFFSLFYMYSDDIGIKKEEKPDGTVTAYVYKVTKDNRILATIKGKTYSICMQGVTISGGSDARRFLKEKVIGQQIELEYDEQARDQGGNIIAYVWLGTEMLNRTMLEKGYAHTVPTLQQTRYIDDFQRRQEQAGQKQSARNSSERFSYFMRTFSHAIA